MTTIRRSLELGRCPQRGSVVVLVLWAIALGAILVAAIQYTTERQAYTGVHAVESVRARWAARGGVERMIATLEFHTLYPNVDDAFAVYRDLADRSYASREDLHFASFAVEHYEDGQVFAGPFDEHKRFNINLSIENSQPLRNLDIPDDIVDAIIDWIDEDDEVTGMGAEAAYYQTSHLNYVPRNSYMRSIAELELVVGAYPEYVRGEDWNLNNLFDPNENDGGIMPPDDNADGYLDVGWAGYLTAYSVAGGLGSRGEPRLYLRQADVEEVRRRTGTSIDQAQALVNFANNPANRLSTLWLTPINYFDEQGNPAPLDGQAVNSALPLDTSQLMLVFSELTMDDPNYRRPGKININTASEMVFRDVLRIEPLLVDEILFHRQRSPRGFVSLVELVGISPNFTADVMAELSDILDVNSNVFTITSTGYSERTGTRVQLIVVVDRSTLPVRILEYREQ